MKSILIITLCVLVCLASARPKDSSKAPKTSGAPNSRAPPPPHSSGAPSSRSPNSRSPNSRPTPPNSSGVPTTTISN